MASKKNFSITTPRGSVFTEVTANGSVQARLEWNPSFARTKAENFSKAQEFVDSECLRYMNPLTPRRTGMMIKSATLNLLVGLAQGVVNALPQLINKAPTIIGQLATAIISNLPKILLAGIKIITILGTGLIQAVPQLISKIPSIISQVKNAFTSVDWGSVGMNIIKGIANGLKGAAGAIVEAAKGAAESALNAAKNALGIHSPSRVFRDQVGKMMALGMGIGFEKNIPINMMQAGLKNVVSSLQARSVAVQSAAYAGAGTGYAGSNTETQNVCQMLSKVAALLEKYTDRPVEANLYLDKRVAAKALAKPIKEENDKMQRENSRKAGIR